ncbi:MAG: hypothetical protein RR984_02550 [Bacilli bacterium]|jgi:hypothetical protein|uniref:hypothetical protein n=1 Tax=Clostridium sp. TaxID=1506 RepID=UPI002FC8BAFD
MKISKEQFLINKAYNQFLTEVVFWSYLYKKFKVDKEQGFNSKNNYEKMISFQETVQRMLPDIEKLNRSKIRSSYPLVDDVALIQYFKDTVGI